MKKYYHNGVIKTIEINSKEEKKMTTRKTIGKVCSNIISITFFLLLALLTSLGILASLITGNYILASLGILWILIGAGAIWGSWDK